MKKYIRNIIFFFIAIAVVDLLFGMACQYLNDHSKGGGIRSRYYVCKESNEEVLIFGSSRAKHHYVPDIIEDSLKMTCYNTGEDGNGIILCYGFLKMITQRYSPKLILYDVSRFDIYEDDNMKYLDLIKPYYRELGIDSIFWRVSPKTRYMMLSEMFRYNTTCLRVLGNYLHPISNTHKGYSPMKGVMDYEPEVNDRKQGIIDETKMFYFEQFLQLAQEKDVKVICLGSPYYGIDATDGFYKSVINLCEQYNVPFLDYTDEPNTKEKVFFNDRTHLNYEGSHIYSSIVAEKIKGFTSVQLNSSGR